jgi:glutathione S-transferase
MTKLYYMPPSNNCRKVLAVVDHLGLDVEHVALDPQKGDLQDPELLAINPNGKVPALDDGEVKLWESNAIIAYLASKKNTSLWPRSNARYDILRWFNWEAAHFNPAASTVYFERLLRPVLGMGDPDSVKVEDGLSRFRRFGAVLNGHVEGRDWLVGGELTLADFSVGSVLTYWQAAELPLDEMPYVAQWYERLSALPAWQNTAPSFG